MPPMWECSSTPPEWSRRCSPSSLCARSTAGNNALASSRGCESRCSVHAGGVSSSSRVTVKNPTPSRPHLTLLVALALSCSTGRQPVFLAPSGESIESGSEMSYGGDGYNVYITNHSSVPIEVTGLKLYDCENIRNQCDLAVPLKVRV